jgi:PmbA protein
MPEVITQDFLSGIIAQALKRGATDAEAIAIETTEFSVEVRLGQVEKLQEAASRGLGLRVLYEGRQASCATSDVSAAAVDALIHDAVEMARLTSVDEAAQLIGKDELATGALPDLNLHDEAIVNLPTERKIEMAKAAEAAALARDPRIVNSEGASCSTTIGRVWMAASNGFAGEYQSTVCGVMVQPIAKEGETMQVGHWGDFARVFNRLDSPELLGQVAADRALRKLGARKVPTQEVPIVFDAEVADSLLGEFFSTISGDALIRRASLFVGKLGEEIAASNLTIIDDGTLPGALGSRPFDGEGLASRRTVVVENGVLKSYLLNGYTARKLNLKSTANATRGLAGAPSVGTGNFFIEPGVLTPAEIIASVQNGFFVTDLIGFGFNPVNGDYSRGAAGLWIENGKLIHSVEEVTIAGNFREMLKGIEMIGNDLRFRGRIAAPTLKVNKMVVSGE